MSKFEDRLWRELVRRHGADLAEMTRPAAKRARRARPRLLAGTTVALAGIGTAAALLLSAASSPPAFAVSRNADGSVTVTLQQISAIHAANARLAALGIRAKLVEVTPGCAYRALPPAAIHAMALARRAAARDGAAQTPVARLDPRKIPAGKLQVLPAWRVAGHVRIAPARLAAAAAPTCFSTLPPVFAAKCAGAPRAGTLKDAPPAPAHNGVIRRAALAKAAATIHTAGGNAKNPPDWVVIGCPVTASALKPDTR